MYNSFINELMANTIYLLLRAGKWLWAGRRRQNWYSFLTDAGISWLVLMSRRLNGVFHMEDIQTRKRTSMYAYHASKTPPPRTEKGIKMRHQRTSSEEDKESQRYTKNDESLLQAGHGRIPENTGNKWQATWRTPFPFIHYTCWIRFSLFAFNFYSFLLRLFRAVKLQFATPEIFNTAQSFAVYGSAHRPVF
jgi:hypothetical protein